MFCAHHGGLVDETADLKKQRHSQPKEKNKRKEKKERKSPPNKQKIQRNKKSKKVKKPKKSLFCVRVLRDCAQMSKVEVVPEEHEEEPEFG